MPPSAPHLTLVTPKAQFASAAKPDIEKELKLVTIDGSSEPFDVFVDRIDAGMEPHIALLQKSAPQRLIARQLDTEDLQLKKLGISLRIRGTYLKEEGRMISPDINIKTSLPNGELGLLRGEYEERIADGGMIDLMAIDNKYREKLLSGLLPDLDRAIDVIGNLLSRDQIIEHFLIDTERTRRVVALDSAHVGLNTDQRFVGELLNDKVRYHVRSPSGQETLQMTVMKGRRELELEPLHVPCAYNHYDGCENDVCRNLDEVEEDLSMLFFREAVAKIADATGHPIENATQSKSGRGFAGWKELTRAFNAIATERTEQRLAIPHGLQLPLPRADGAAIPLVVSVPNINVPWGLKAA